MTRGTEASWISLRLPRMDMNAAIRESDRAVAAEQLKKTVGVDHPDAQSARRLARSGAA